MERILISYAELTLKGNNRHLFDQALKNDIKAKLKKYNYEMIHTYNRIFIDAPKNELKEIIKILTKVPGIQYIYETQKVETSEQIIQDQALNYFQNNYQSGTMAVKVNRRNKNFPINSADFAKKIASNILINHNKPIKVKLKNPDFLVLVEIIDNYSYIITKRHEGIKGLPVGSSGRGLLLLSGGIDSPVAAYEMIKRGLRIEAIHFTSPPYISDQSVNKVLELVEKISQYDGQIKLHIVPITDLQVALKQNCDNRYSIILLRRMMLRIATDFANKKNISVLITGESLGQVASQTVESMYVINEVTTMPILRPLVNQNKEEIIAVSQMIDTYDISIQPFDDCCTLFMPKNPVTQPKLEHALLEEAKLDYKNLINKIEKNIKTYTLEEINNNQKYF